jgi:hypothetical protein
MERSVAAESEIRVAFARARRVLLEDPGVVFSEFREPKAPRDTQFDVELTVALGAGASAHQAVELELGPAHTTAAGLELPLRWQAAGREHLFPRFVGQLTLSEARPGTRVRLSGNYTVPLGTIGRFGDGVFGHRLARRSLETFVHDLGARLATEVERRLAPNEPRRGTAFSSTVDERDHSEIHVG